jgi:ribonuclease HII
MLKKHLNKGLIEAGCDEAGRGCLCGAVYAAAVILPKNFKNLILTDSKQLSAKQRNELRTIIESEALAWAVASVDEKKVDEINILQASVLAMHLAITALKTRPEFLIIDGNYFKAFENIPHLSIVKGDSKYMSIAAASVLAKTHRDEYMEKMDQEFPIYGWKKNKGYGTLQHRTAIMEHGICPYHRRSFNLNFQLNLKLD